jgi:hypothetical protein
MIIADDKSMKKNSVCPGIRFEPISKNEIGMGRSWSFTKEAKNKLKEEGALSNF